MITKIILSLITAFLFITGVFLIIKNKEIEGNFYDSTAGRGWVHNSFNGYFLVLISIGFLIALIFVIKGKKINP